MKYDKQVIIQVLGSLLQKPSIILDDNYRIELDDFPTDNRKFYRIIYGAIHNLAMQGASKLTALELVNYLSKLPNPYAVFKEFNGEDYITNCRRMAQIENFPYYFNTLKKTSLLAMLEGKGFDIKPFYDSNTIDPKVVEEKKKKLDSMSLEDILNHYEGNFLSIRSQYVRGVDEIDEHAGYRIDQMVEKYEEEPEMGMPMRGKIFTTIASGMLLQHFHLISAAKGTGKSRYFCGEASNVAIAKYYDWNLKKWIDTGISEPTLLIITEQTMEQARRAVLAYVSGVDSNDIRLGKTNAKQKEIIKEANNIIKESPLWFRKVNNFSAEDIKRAVKTYKAKHNIGYVFFDYIYSNSEMLSNMVKKTRGISLREDSALSDFGAELKFLCDQYNIYLMTGTQTNGKEKDAVDIDDECIRGAKALGDKVNVGAVLTEVRPTDLETVNTILEKKNAFSQTPNYILHVYKVRDGVYTKLKLWIHIDLGTCRVTDLFATTRENELVEIKPTNVTKVIEKNTTKRELASW